MAPTIAPPINWDEIAREWQGLIEDLTATLTAPADQFFRTRASALPCSARRLAILRALAADGTNWQVVIVRLSQLTQQTANAYLWEMAERVEPYSVARLGLLLVCSEVVLQRPAGWDYAAVRQAHQREGVRAGYWHCFGCGKGHPLYRHHIIEVQHGGDNNSRNQVPLCFHCHQAIHPWLVEPRAYSNWHRVGLDGIVADLLDGGGGLGTARDPRRVPRPGASPQPVMVADHSEIAAAIQWRELQRACAIDDDSVPMNSREHHPTIDREAHD